jgi:hypothetical protein
VLHILPSWESIASHGSDDDALCKIKCALEAELTVFHSYFFQSEKLNKTEVNTFHLLSNTMFACVISLPHSIGIFSVKTFYETNLLMGMHCIHDSKAKWLP